MRFWIVRAAAVALLILTIAACNGGDPRHSRFPRRAEHYRLLRDTDFCGELPLFAQADPRTMIGTVLDGAQRYIDPQTGREFRAISVLTIVNSKRVDRWYRRERLVGHVYVLTNDPRLNECGYWLDEEKPVRPLSPEIPAE